MTPAQCNGDAILTHMVLRNPAGVGSRMCSFHEDNLQTEKMQHPGLFQMAKGVEVCATGDSRGRAVMPRGGRVWGTPQPATFPLGEKTALCSHPCDRLSRGMTGLSALLATGPPPLLQLLPRPAHSGSPEPSCSVAKRHPTPRGAILLPRGTQAS